MKDTLIWFNCIERFHCKHCSCNIDHQYCESSMYVYVLLRIVANHHDTKLNKGKTVMSEQERYDSVKHCRYVDEVLEGAPWTITSEFLDKHQVQRSIRNDVQL